VNDFLGIWELGSEWMIWKINGGVKEQGSGGVNLAAKSQMHTLGNYF